MDDPQQKRPSEPLVPSAPRWPPVRYEPRPWQLEHTGHISKTQLRRVTGPYEAAIVPAIAHLTQVPLSGELLALADDATAEIARFDGGSGALIAPFASVLLRSESAASSKIELLTASARAIALAELGVSRANNARLIVANSRAMEAAIDLADSLDASAIIAMQATLLGDTNPEFVGAWRSQQVWIGGSNFGPHQAMFVPPHHERVPAAMDDLVDFLRRDDIPALIHAAIAHAQFETIHPFPDGNGRTGRALIHALLRARGVATNVTVPISAGLLTDTSAYFNALTHYRDGDPEPIVRSLADASFAAIENGGLLVDELTRISDDWKHRLKARKDSVAWRIADLLIAQPAVSWTSLHDTFGVGPASGYRALDRLVDAGILIEISGKGWGRIWTAPEILTALDDFAARAGRRVSG